MERQDSHKGVLLVLSPQTSEFLSNQADAGPTTELFSREKWPGDADISPKLCAESQGPRSATTPGRALFILRVHLGS